MKIVVRILLALIVTLLGVFVWWYYIDTRAPESRPDLVRMPEYLPKPPKGYPSTHALELAFLRGRLDLFDLEAEAKKPVPEGIRETLDVEYGRVGDRPLVLDLFTPKNLTKPVPAILFFHGGGWSKGDKADYRFYAVHFAQQGYVVASVGYRLKKEALYPAAIEDTKCAVRYVRAHAEELHVDPDRIAVIGGSAGGHLAMMIGYSSDVSSLEGTGGWPDTSSAVRVVVDLYGPTDFTTPYARTHKTTTSYIGKSYEEAPKLYEEISPLFHLDESDPPTLIFQGTLDDLVPVTQSDRLAQHLEALGIPVWYDRIDGWPHTMDITRPVNDHVKTVVSAFFEQYLRGDGTSAVKD